jgi:hypothetical protein
MSIGDNRKHTRVETNIKASYVIIDDRGNKIEKGLGKILDISLGGVLLETIKPIGLHNILLTTSGIDDETLNMKGDVAYCKMEDSRTFKGDVAYCKMEDSRTFRTGIKFLEHIEDIQLFVKSLLKIYSKQKTQN